MADTTYYAWSNFKVEHNKEGQVTKWIRAGDPITQSDLGCSDEEWKEYINLGVVSKKEHPPVPVNVAPVEYDRVDDEKKALLEEAAQSNTSTTSAPGINAPAQQQQQGDAAKQPPAPGTPPGDK